MFTLLMTLAALAQPAPQVPDAPVSLNPRYMEMADSADYYIERSLWADAKRCTVEALRADPANFSNSLLLSNLGMINLNLDEPQDAVDNFTLGLEIAPSSTTLRSNRARAYLYMNQLQKADEDLRILLERTPDDPWALKMHGIITASKNPEEGLAVLQRIAEPDVDTRLAMASLQHRMGHDDEAELIYSALTEDSASEEVLQTAAVFHLLKEDYSRAGDELRRAIELNPRNGNLYLLRAYLHEQCHEKSLAEIDKKMAIENNADLQLVEALFPSKKRKK